ncbi:MAG: flagellar brake protein [Gammaproteobacteria bacterium]
MSLFDWIKDHLGSSPDESQSGTPESVDRLLDELTGQEVRVDLVSDALDPGTTALMTANGGGLHMRLNSASAQAALLPGTAIQVHARMGGMSIHFETRAQSMRGNELFAPLPDDVEFAQLRRQNRTSINSPAGLAVYQMAEDNQTQTMQARVRDVSMGGIGLSVDGDSTLKPGDHLDDVIINLPDGKQISGSLEIRHTRNEDETTLVGGLFREDGNDEGNDLASIVSMLAEDDDKDDR